MHIKENFETLFKKPSGANLSPEELIRLHWKDRNFIQKLFLLFLGRSPKMIEHKITKRLIDTKNIDALLNYLLKDIGFAQAPANPHQHKIEIAQPQYLYIDITDTRNCFFLSGIQRVVLSLIVASLRAGLKVRPFVIDPNRGAIALNDVQIEAFMRFETPKDRPELQIDHNALLFLHNAPVLVPEICLDDFRRDFFEVNRSAFKSLGFILYDLIPLMKPEYFDVGLVGLFESYIQLVHKADRVSTISPTVATHLTKHEQFLRTQGTKSIPLKKIKAHTLSADKNLLGSTVQKSSALSSAGIAEASWSTSLKKDFVIQVSTLEPRKNHIRVLHGFYEHWKKNPNCPQLVFAGRPGWRNEEIYYWLNYYKNIGVPVLYLEAVTDAQLDELYSSCMATIFCSEIEGFGLPVLESLLYGKPVLTSNVGSMKEISKDLGGCVLIDPLSVQSVSEGFKKLFQKKYSKIKNKKPKTWLQYAKEINSFFNGSKK